MGGEGVGLFLAEWVGEGFWRFYRFCFLLFFFVCWLASTEDWAEPTSLILVFGLECRFLRVGGWLLNWWLLLVVWIGFFLFLGLIGHERASCWCLLLHHFFIYLFLFLKQVQQRVRRPNKVRMISINQRGLNLNHVHDHFICRFQALIQYSFHHIVHSWLQLIIPLEFWQLNL